MKECYTVKEVLAKVFDYDFGTSVSYQVHFADATGDVAVIHPQNGEMMYTRKGKGFLISTNFNLSGLETGALSCCRNSTASRMLAEIGVKNDLSIEAMTAVLAATHIEGYLNTFYSTLCDLKTGDIYPIMNFTSNHPTY